MERKLKGLHGDKAAPWEVGPDHSMKGDAELKATVLQNATGTLPVLCLDY